MLMPFYEENYTKVDWMREGVQWLLEYDEVLRAVPQPQRGRMATRRLGEGRAMEREGTGGFSPAAKRLLRRAR